MSRMINTTHLWKIYSFVKAGSSKAFMSTSPDTGVVRVAGRAGGIMKGWRICVQRHVPSPLIPRPSLFTTSWSRHVNKDTWCCWVQSKPPSAHFLSSRAFYLLSTESQCNFPLRDHWISKTLTFHAHKKWCGDADVCICLTCLFCFFN